MFTFSKDFEEVLLIKFWNSYSSINYLKSYKVFFENFKNHLYKTTMSKF